jgi:hypothetical protein
MELDTIVILWLIRAAHVLGGGLWVGGYALLALVVIPWVEREATPQGIQLAIVAVRLLTYTGVGTIFFGLLLTMRTRGFAALLSGGEWG